MTNSTLSNNVNMKINRPKRFCFIIGAMKCGTTSIFDILSQHPQICASRIKEPDYFSNSGDYKNIDEYLSIWKWDERKHKIALESSVSYAKAPFVTGVPFRIHESSLGEYRFIYILRNPLKRIESQVRHGIFAGWGKSLDDGITRDLIDFSRYAMQLDEYLEYFISEQIFVITLEEFQQEPQDVLRRLCKFLQVDDTFIFKNVSEPRNTGSFFNAPPVMASLTQGRTSQIIIGWLPAGLKALIRNFIGKLHRDAESEQDNQRWKLTRDEKTYILNELRADLSRLRLEFDIDTEKYWNIPDHTVSRIE